MKVAYESGSKTDIEFVEEYLKNCGLNTLIRYKGSGSYLNITTGYPIGTMQWLVDDDKVDEAKGYINEITPQKISMPQEVLKKNWGVRLYAWIALLLTVGGVILAIAFS